MAERADRARVGDMVEAADRMLRFTGDTEFAAFVADERTVDAVLRNLVVLGEAAARVSDETRALAPSVEWGRIVRSRHIAVHDYFGVDLEIVWRIVQVHLPPLQEHLRALLTRLPEEP